MCLLIRIYYNGRVEGGGKRLKKKKEKVFKTNKANFFQFLNGTKKKKKILLVSINFQELKIVEIKSDSVFNPFVKWFS